MYLEVVVIDYLNVDGKLSNFTITPKGANSHVIADSLSEIQRLRNRSTFSIGSTMIYNSDQCQIRQIESQLRSFKHDSISNSAIFQFSHKNLPLGPSYKGHGGLWNFQLPPSWRLRELRVIDPYDKSSEIMEEKREFTYTVFWDEECKTQIVEMELRSKRGSFSFEIIGIMSFIDLDDSDVKYIASKSSSYAVEMLENIRFLDKKGKSFLSKQILKKANWLELKPNLWGLGININAIIESIDSNKN